MTVQGHVWRMSITVAAAVVSATLLTGVLVGVSGAPAYAETISSALARAYAFSPDLNAQRAGLRATDENLPAAAAGYRPTVTATGNAGDENLIETTPGLGTAAFDTFPRTAALTATETLFDGFKTANTMRQSESQIFQGRESLRLGEQNILERRRPSLYECAARYRHSRPGQQQCLGFAAAAEADPGRISGRRGHPYRCRPGAVEPVPGPGHCLHGAVQSADETLPITASLSASSRPTCRLRARSNRCCRGRSTPR